jgi:hypothetical protein
MTGLIHRAPESFNAEVAEERREGCIAVRTLPDYWMYLQIVDDSGEAIFHVRNIEVQ